MPRRLFILLIAILSLVALAEEPPPFTREVSHTSEGTFVVYHRATATAVDLEMPIVGALRITESFVYHVRDRKKRDILRFAHVVFSSAKSAEETTAYYAGVLGASAARETDPATGAVTLTAGTAENFRLVVITPKPDGCDARLERVMRFTYPPRVYTADEQRVLRVLREVAATYRQAGHIAYAMAQNVELSPAMSGVNTPPTLCWQVDFTRPATISVTAKVGDTLGLAIVTKDGALQVTRPESPPEMRPLKDAITLTDVPELHGDPVARLLFGEDLLADGVDYLALSTVKGAPAQVAMTLTFPEQNEMLTLVIDRRSNTVLRSEVLTTGEQGRWTRMRRDYTDLQLTPAIPAPAPAGADTHRSQTESPAVPGP